jgi:hypothetical protein
MLWERPQFASGCNHVYRAGRSSSHLRVFKPIGIDPQLGARKPLPGQYQEIGHLADFGDARRMDVVDASSSCRETSLLSF